MGEWGYGVGEREGCYGSCRGTGLCIEGFGMLLGWEGRGEGWWMGGCDGRDSILSAFWEMGFWETPRVNVFRL